MPIPSYPGNGDRSPSLETSPGSYGSRWGADRASGAADAIDLLLQDHRTVEILLSKMETPDPRERFQERAQVRAICETLSLHSIAEYELVLPVARQHIQDPAQNLWRNATAEQEKTKALIAELQACESNPLLSFSMLKVLAEHVRLHMSDEERYLFPALRATGADLEALGDRIVERKRELRASYLICSND